MVSWHYCYDQKRPVRPFACNRRNLGLCHKEAGFFPFRWPGPLQDMFAQLGEIVSLDRPIAVTPAARWAIRLKVKHQKNLNQACCARVLEEGPACLAASP